MSHVLERGGKKDVEMWCDCTRQQWFHKKYMGIGARRMLYTEIKELKPGMAQPHVRHRTQMKNGIYFTKPYKRSSQTHTLQFRGSVELVEALCYKPEGRGIESRGG
jgi:hypothetical protein